MPSPFPGMDPYLEDAVYWPDIHHNLATYIRDDLSPRIRPTYYAHVGERVYITGAPNVIIPDVSVIKLRQRPRPIFPVPPRWSDEGRAGTAVASDTAVVDRLADEPEIVVAPTLAVRESFVNILDTRRGGKIVTVIEILSPTNKAYGSDGYHQYRRKQREVLESDSNLVEIDLLRDGFTTIAFAPELIPPRWVWDYVVAVNRVGHRDQFEVYRRTVRERLPCISIPLEGSDPDVVLDIQAILEKCYRNGDYERILDYSSDPPYPLRAVDQEWARGLIADIQAQAGHQTEEEPPGDKAGHANGMET